MNYLMVDISGKVPNYDIALCEAMHSVFAKEDKVTLLAANIDPSKIDCPSKKLLSIIPKYLQNSENKIKRAFKALEGIVNYLYLILYVLLKQNQVIHFQWLPFLEISSIEKIFLKCIKVVSPKSKIILTVHNIYPHNSSKSGKIKYKKRFATVEKFFDHFVLHLKTSKDEFCEEFCIDSNRCQVIHHGVFSPKGLQLKNHSRGDKLNLIMYGNQSYYKGTDILVDALALLPDDCKNKVHTEIVGKIAPDYLQELQTKSVGLDIEWTPEFVSDEILNAKIMASDVIVLPYREISQSGVLLLALYFEKIIIASDLPSFKETLVSIPDEFFFDKDSPEKLANAISKIVSTRNTDVECLQKFTCLKNEYSWAKIAFDYIKLLRG